MVSQIIVSVTAAVCVAFITNAYLTNGGDDSAASLSVTPAPAVSTAAATGPAAARAGDALPPLDVEEIADVPDGVVPGEEVFPGAPVGVRPEALQRAVSEANAGEEPKERRRRFLGIPIPFTSTADVAEEDVKGG